MEAFKMIKSFSIPQEWKVNHEWRIDQFLSSMKFSMYNNDATTINSPSYFSDNTEDLFPWTFKIKFNNDDDDDVDKEWISIIIKYIGDSQRIKVKYSLFIFDDKKEKKFENEIYKVFKKNEDMCIPKFLNINQLLTEKDKLLPDDALTICIELTEFIECYNSHTIKTPLKTSNRQIVHDLKDLFDSKAGRDVVLVVGNKKIPAHKILLMSRSPVFSAMFIHKLKENKENKVKFDDIFPAAICGCKNRNIVFFDFPKTVDVPMEVNIPDMDPDTCDKLLEFIYTDNVTNLDGVAERLFEAADKYKLPTLKDLCEESFCKNVNIENAVEYLVLLDRHNGGEEFFTYILDFIAINSNKIIETPEFKALEKTNTELSLTILTKICSIK